MRVPPDVSAQVLEAHPDALLLLDGTGHLVHANRAALHLLGLKREAMVRVHLSELFAEERAHCEGVLRQGRRSTTPTPASLRLRTAEGRDMPCRCEIAMVPPTSAESEPHLWCRLVPDNAGHSKFQILNQQISALQLEVDRRLKAEAESRRQGDWLKTVLLSLAEGVIATGPDGAVLLMNTAATELTGCKPEDAMQRHIREVVRLASDQGPLDPWSGSGADMEGGADPRLTNQRLVLHSCLGESRHVQVSRAPIQDEVGAVLGAVLVIRSIHDEVLAEQERQRLEQQLRQAQKMDALGTLAGGIAHDFNNVVAAVIGNTMLAQSELTPDHPAQEALHQVQRAGERARALVRQILAFGRRQPSKLEAQPLQPLVHEVVALLRSTLPPRVSLVVEMCESPVEVLVDAVQFHQVLMNLVTNAWHALPQTGGDIHVALDIEPFGADDFPHARLSVADNGCGMDEATRERIFEPFFTTKPSGVGTGLGLSVVHGIVADHLGAIEVHSAPGKGTTFIVRLPARVSSRSPEEPAPATAEVVHAGPSAKENSVHLMYVDDDEMMRSLVQRWLNRRGHQVTCHEAGAGVLTQLADPAVRCDLVITDFNMPKSSGLELARDLRSLRPGLPVVITSGNLSEDLRQGAQELGGIVLLEKAESFDGLSALLQQVIEGGLLNGRRGTT